MNKPVTVAYQPNQRHKNKEHWTRTLCIITT